MWLWLKKFTFITAVSRFRIGSQEKGPSNTMYSNFETPRCQLESISKFKTA